MEVKCIKSGGWNYISYGFPVEGPVKGEICLVLDEAGGYYRLKGYDHAVYRKTRFKPHNGTESGMQTLTALLKPKTKQKIDA